MICLMIWQKYTISLNYITMTIFFIYYFDYDFVLHENFFNESKYVCFGYY